MWKKLFFLLQYSPIHLKGRKHVKTKWKEKKRRDHCATHVSLCRKFIIFKLLLLKENLGRKTKKIYILAFLHSNSYFKSLYHSSLSLFFQSRMHITVDFRLTDIYPHSTDRASSKSVKASVVRPLCLIGSKHIKDAA